METTPSALVALAIELGAAQPRRVRHGFGVPRGEWTINLGFLGYYPIPPVEASFGKRSSSLLSTRRTISCTEVELTKRLRRHGWAGGWVNSYERTSRNRTLPEVWRRWMITPNEAERLFRSEYPIIATVLARAFKSNEGGTPDVVVSRGTNVLAIECKRLRDRYLANDGTWKTYAGDRSRQTQTAWLGEARGHGFRDASFLVLDWCRSDPSISPTAQCP